jgi:hypothetical protein
MKSWWWSINALVFLSSFLACPARQPAEVQKSVDIKDSIAILQDTMSKDGVTFKPDSIPPTETVQKIDSLSKNDKYSQREGGKQEAPKHGTPDPEKLDSIKQKKKKKD